MGISALWPQWCQFVECFHSSSDVIPYIVFLLPNLKKADSNSKKSAPFLAKISVQICVLVLQLHLCQVVAWADQIQWMKGHSITKIAKKRTQQHYKETISPQFKLANLFIDTMGTHMPNYRQRSGVLVKLFSK